MNIFKKMTIALLVLVTSITLITTVYTPLYNKLYVCQGICDFVPERDTTFFVDTFKKNWYWLLPDGTLNFNPQDVINKRTNPAESHHGKLAIKMYYQKGEPLGFIVYYKEMLHVGFIWFIVVDDTKRVKGVGSALFSYAVNDLENQGVSRIRLMTRTDNIPAQALYKKFGFVELDRSEKYLWFEKRFEN